MISENVKKFIDMKNEEIRARTINDDTEMRHFLDQHIDLILTHRSIEHPFLNHYAKHGLSQEQERVLFLECYYFFRHLPFYIAGMANQTRDELILRELLLNVQDEIGDGKTTFITHSMIFNDFLNRIGIKDDDIENYKPLAVTRELNDGIRKLYTESEIRKGLGALYVDETMSGIMVSKLNDGLAHHWDEETRYFFLLHMEVELGHSNGVFNALYPIIHEAETQALFKEGMHKFLALLEAYWDGVGDLVMGMQPRGGVGLIFARLPTRRRARRWVGASRPTMRRVRFGRRAKTIARVAPGQKRH